MVKPVEVMSLARVVSTKKLKDTGLSKGDLVLVMSVKPVPAKPGDPYLMRNLVVVAKIGDNGLPQIPKDSNDYKAILLDPRSLERVSDSEQKDFNNVVSKAYTGV